MKPNFASAWTLMLWTAGVVLTTPIAAGAPLLPASQPALADGARHLDPALASWQPDFMLQLPGGRPDGNRGGAQTSHAVRGPNELLSDPGIWIQGPPAPKRYGHTAVYDPIRDRMLLFGGTDYDSLRSDVWELTLSGYPRWTLLFPLGSGPGPRYLHTAIYDPVRDRVVVFGGSGTGGNRNDVWALSLAGSLAWSAITPSGSPPPVRAGHTAFYDPLRDRMVVFGGSNLSYLNDTWELSLGAGPAWTMLEPAGIPPAARGFHAACYDPVRDRLVVFGGESAGGLRNDAWDLSFSGGPVWAALTPTGGPPVARSGGALISDAPRDRMVLFGGIDSGAWREDAWELSLVGSTAWSPLTPGGMLPGARDLHTAFVDPVRGRMIVFGGRGWAGALNDSWALGLGETPVWSELAPSGVSPSARRDMASIYDPVRRRVVVFGGLGAAGFCNDVHALSLSGISGWSQLLPAGTVPSPRAHASGVYDPVRDRMLIFGGFSNEVWALSLSGTPAWSALAPTGIPPSARYGQSAIYDPMRDRMLVFGGNGSSTLYHDVWALELSGVPGWIALTPVGAPPSARYQHAAIYDPGGDRMVVFGGYDGSFRNDVWTLSLAGTPEWSALVPTGTLPSPRYDHSAIYDSARERMVLFGGINQFQHFGDVQALSLEGSPAWTEPGTIGTGPGRRLSHAAIYDPAGDRMVMFGGASAGGIRNDTWSLWWGSPAPVSVGSFPRELRCALAPPRPNPSRVSTTLAFAVADGASASLAIYDLVGRQVRSLLEGASGPRHSSMVWDHRDGRGRRVPAGVYFARLSAAGGQIVRKIVLLRDDSRP